MIVTCTMNLGQLLYLMPDDATYADAERLRSLLVEHFPDTFTSMIPAAMLAALVTESTRIHREAAR